MNEILPKPPPPRLKQPGNKSLVEPLSLALWLSCPRRLLCRLHPQKLSLLPIDLILPTEQIHVLGFNPGVLHQQLIPKDHNQVQRDSQIPRDKVLWVPRGEDVEVLEDGNEAAHEQGTDGTIFAEGRGVWHLGIGDALCAPGVDEVDVGDQDRDPGEDSEDGGEVDKVQEDLLGGC